MYGYYLKKKTFENRENLNPRARHIIMDSRMVRGTEFRGKIIKYWQTKYINFHHMSTASNLIQSIDPLQNSEGQEKSDTKRHNREQEV